VTIWSRCVECFGEKPKGKRTLRRPSVGWEDIIKVAIWSMYVECIDEEI